MGEARRRKLAGTMPEKTDNRAHRFCDVCDRRHVPLRPVMFERPARHHWPEVHKELHVCYPCSIELTDSARMAFPGDDMTANRITSRLFGLTHRPWAWHREPEHPRLFFVKEK